MGAKHVIQSQLNKINIKCVCQRQSSPPSIVVYYFDKEHIGFGVDEKLIDTVCHTKLMLGTCTSTKIDTEWKALKMKIFQRDDYGKDICLFDDQNTVSLFGLPEVVKHLQKLFENIQTNNAQDSDTSKINEPKALIDPKPQTPKVDSTSKLTECKTTEKSIPNVVKIPQTDSKTFDIDEPGFEVLVNNNINQLLAIVESKCKLDKQVLSNRIQIQVPKANEHFINANTLPDELQEPDIENSNNSRQDSENQKSNWFLQLFQRSKPKSSPLRPKEQESSTVSIDTQSSASNTNNVTIGKSKIIVCSGDLTKQMVSHLCCSLTV